MNRASIGRKRRLPRFWSTARWRADEPSVMSIADRAIGSVSRLFTDVEAAREHRWPHRDRLRPDFRIDRRSNPRWPVRGNASVLPLGADLGVVVELDRLDGSPWWIGGDATTALRVGARVSVGFSAPDGRPATGSVMRCEPKSDERFRIAIRFDGGSPV